MGHLGADAEYRATRNGHELAFFSVAADARDGGENKTLWFRCTIWGKRSKSMAASLKKGDFVYISGNVRTVKDLDVNVLDIKKIPLSEEKDTSEEEELEYCYEYRDRYLCDSL